MTEPKKWRQFEELKIGLAHGPDKAAILNDPKFDIVVMNYDGLTWAEPHFKKHKFDVLVCDEITKLKHTNSKRFKALKPHLTSFTFKWGLTGTPAANGLMDLFGQVYVLDEGQRLGRYITHFRAKFFHQVVWDQYRYYITPEKSEELTLRLKDLAMYLDPKDHLTLPALLDIVIPIKLQRMGEYKFFRDEYILKLQNETFTAVNAGALTSKLRQFTGGAMYNGVDGYEVLSDEKIKALEDLVEEMAGEPLLVAYQFTHELARLKKAFPQSLAIRGGTSKLEIQKAVQEWNQGNVPILFVQPAAASHGINLQFGGSAICWYSLTYNLEEYIQLIARLYRQGQTQIVRNYNLVAQGTIDEVLVKVLTTKDATQNLVFQALKKEV